ncbi:MAG: low molecular weight protein arginine phosphatase [Candidatus Bathyarchaeota archaeon]|nr:low molecular weight protein arginine phosphatase [Candidatus Bathyarchaeota archaeon]
MSKTYKNILFVCDANTFRSPIAKLLLEKMLSDNGIYDVKVYSAGVASYARDGSLISMDVKLLLKDEGIIVDDGFCSKDLKRHKELLEQSDLILTMTKKQKEAVLVFKEAKGKSVYTLKEFIGEDGDIMDPQALGDEGYIKCKEEIKRCLLLLLEQLKKK